MQGVFIHGSRPPTKKYLKAAVNEINEGGDAFAVVIEATSLFGNEFDGSLHRALNPLNDEPQQTGPFYLVGPDPHKSRKWYATLEFVQKEGEDEGKWVVK